MPGAKNSKETDELDENGKKKAGAAGGEGENDGAEDDAAGSAEDDAAAEGGEDFKDPVKALAEIKKLRAENAKHRTQNKSLKEEMGKVTGTMTKLKTALGVEGSDDEDPEKQVATLKQQNEALQVQAALNELISEHEIPKAGQKYFNYLISQEFEMLEDGDEISDERIAELAKETKKMFSAGGGSTGVNGKKNAPNPEGDPGSISAAQFAKMNSGEKSALYTKDQAQYQKLFNEAKEKRLL